MKTLFLLLCLLNSLVAWAVQITVEVDRNPVHQGESFQLTYTASDNPDGNPDFEPLTRDFDVLNQGHSSQASWVNGKSSNIVQWTVQLMAKNTGNLVIPGIAFGQDQTEPMTIQVTPPANNSDVDSNAELLLKVEATPLNPYVQAQVLYTLRLYRRVNIAQARLDDPKLPDAVVQKLGEDSNYNTQVNGVDYVVTERKYAIFPQKSGTVNIEPLNLTAQVVSADPGRFNSFFSQQSTRTQKVLSNAITLEVRPAPNTASMPHWLPAEDLQLQQEWSGDSNAMKVGEPITRTLRVVAKGATVGLLPELHHPTAAPSIKTYPDQPALQEMPKPDGIFALREEKVAIIPSAAGSYTLPAIEIPWFNTKTQKKEIATLPASTITVAATTPATTVTPTPTSNSSPLNLPAVPITQNAVAQTLTDAPTQNPWFWVSVGLSVCWLSTLGYFLRRPKPTASVVDLEVTAPPSKQPNVPQLLKQACLSNNPQLAKEALLLWGQATHNTQNLGDLAECCGEPLSREIQLLNQLLYAPNSTETPSNWQGNPLLDAFNAQQPNQATSGEKTDDALEPLYRL